MPNRTLFRSAFPQPIVRALAAAAAAWALGGSVAGQDASSLPQSMIETAAPLAPEQKTRLGAFVSAQVRQLAEGEPDRVGRARVELSTPPGRPGASETFRREYAAIVRPALAPIIAGTDEMRTINALIVIASLRSPESVDLLLERSDPSREPRLAVRIRASSSLADAIAQAPLTPAQIDGATRRLSANAGQETDWVPILHAFRAIVRIVALPGLPDASVGVALRAETELLAQLVDRIRRESAASPLMNAMAQALLSVRNQLTTMPADRATTLRRDLAPTLVGVARATVAHWDSARADQSLARVYGSALGVVDLILALAATDRRTPGTFAFVRAWESGSKVDFEAELKRAETMFPRGR
ncbi:MAG TPA: hypothetical protein PKC43_01455 [Phycisphaerales bacterium]|nr:hypothetical protein [Phycisphaerales bacterium]HMP36092.1 hypothetical protein [Phycisphaerales bacterium]